ncbi:papI protein [Escherichia coli]|nr:papI protein [Escherichia coli]EGE2401449.1 papI protein [Escherichia coli]KAA1948716.1 papI protein [Escherichia coli]KAA2167283.1 papI protein [Escherichia coli]KZI68666.1 papI protein [Escherichia coli]
MLSVINGKVFLFSVFAGFAVFAVFALFVQFSEFAFYWLYLICITFCVLFFCEKKVRKNAFRRSFML